mgnify:CR=1 FL=1
MRGRNSIFGQGHGRWNGFGRGQSFGRRRGQSIFAPIGWRGSIGGTIFALASFLIGSWLERKLFGEKNTIQNKNFREK